MTKAWRTLCVKFLMMKLQIIFFVLLVKKYESIKIVHQMCRQIVELDNVIMKMITNPTEGNKGKYLIKTIEYYLQMLYDMRKQIRIGNKEIMPQAEKLFIMDKPNFILQSINSTVLMKKYLWKSKNVQVLFNLTQEVLELWESSKFDFEKRKCIDIKVDEETKRKTKEKIPVQDWWDSWDVPELDTEEEVKLKGYKSLFE